MENRTTAQKLVNWQIDVHGFYGNFIAMLSRIHLLQEQAFLASVEKLEGGVAESVDEIEYFTGEIDLQLEKLNLATEIGKTLYNDLEWRLGKPDRKNMEIWLAAVAYLAGRSYSEMRKEYVKEELLHGDRIDN